MRQTKNKPRITKCSQIDNTVVDGYISTEELLEISIRAGKGAIENIEKYKSEKKLSKMMMEEQIKDPNFMKMAEKQKDISKEKIDIETENYKIREEIKRQEKEVKKMNDDLKEIKNELNEKLIERENIEKGGTAKTDMQKLIEK